VTRHTQSFTRVFWTLDRDLASARVFPAISLRDSYSDAVLDGWWGSEWARLRRDALALLEEAARLEATARLIGADSLPDRQRFLLSMAQLLREGFLIQNATDPADACCAPKRQIELLSLLMKFASRGLDAVGRGTSPERIFAQPVAATLARARVTPALDGLAGEIERALP
jgi:V/A-type H+-transporting ATPase subunit A